MTHVDGSLGVHSKIAGPGDLGSTRIRDDEIVDHVVRYQLQLDDWQLRGLDLASLARRAHGWYESMRSELLPSFWSDGRSERAVAYPLKVHLTLEPTSRRILGSYRLGRSGSGLRWQINLNPIAIIARPSSARAAAVLVHEALHLAEEEAGRPPRSKNNFHSASFCRQAREIGLPCTNYGVGLGVLAESPFSRWLEQHGVTGEFVIVRNSDGPEPVAAKRIVWVCHCADPVAVLVPRGSTLKAVCQRCHAEFLPRERIDTRHGAAKGE